MTKAAKNRRTVRHELEPELINALHRTSFGKRATVGQVKAAARQILMRATAGEKVTA